MPAIHAPGIMLGRLDNSFANLVSLVRFFISMIVAISVLSKFHGIRGNSLSLYTVAQASPGEMSSAPQSSAHSPPPVVIFTKC